MEVGIKDFETNLLILRNIQDGKRIERFKFTPTEESAIRHQFVRIYIKRIARFRLNLNFLKFL